MSIFESEQFQKLKAGESTRIDDDAVCPTCGLVKPSYWLDSYEIAAKCKCAEKHQMAEERRYDLANLPRRNVACTFENFKVPSGSAEALQTVKDFADGHPPHILMLWGESGAGKTHLMEAAASQLLYEGFAIRYEYSPDLLNRIKATFNNQESTEDVLHYYRDVPILFLDDVGTERSTDWTAEALTSLVDERYRNQRRLMVNSNCSYAQLCDRGYTRLASRLFDTQTGAAKNVQVSGDFRRGS